MFPLLASSSILNAYPGVFLMNWWSYFSFILSSNKSQDFCSCSQMRDSIKFFIAELHFGKTIFLTITLSVISFSNTYQFYSFLVKEWRIKRVCSLAYLHSVFYHSLSYLFVWFSFTKPNSKIFCTKLPVWKEWF